MDLKKTVECPLCGKQNTITVLSGGKSCWHCGEYIPGIDMEQVSGDEKIDLIARQFKQDVIKQLNTYDDDRWPPIDLILDYYACRLDYDERIKLEDSLRRWLLEEGFFTGIKLNVFDNKLYCECNLTEKGKKVWCKAERRMIRESKTIFDQISDGCTILFVIAVIFVILIFLGFCVTYCSGS